MQYFLAQNSTCYNIGMLCFFRDKWSNNSTHIFITFMTLKGSQNSPEHSTSSFELPRHDVLFSQRTRRKTAFSHKLWKHMTETRKELRHFIGRLHILRPPPRGAHVTENDLLILQRGAEMQKEGIPFHARRCLFSKQVIRGWIRIYQKYYLTWKNEEINPRED